MKTVVFWRKFVGISYLSGESGEFEPFMPGGSGAALLHRLRRMPRAVALSYEDACRMVQAECHVQVDLGNNEPDQVGHSNWIMTHWPEWLASRGYHVELQGDEFEVVSLQNHAA